MRRRLGSGDISSNMAWRMGSRKVMGAMGYLRAFPRAADFAGADFLAGGLVAGFAGGFVFAAGSSLAGCVSPKWIGAFSREEVLPRPKPSTIQTGSTLDLGGGTSAMGRSPLGRILWQSSHVPY